MTPRLSPASPPGAIALEKRCLSCRTYKRQHSQFLQPFANFSSMDTYEINLHIYLHITLMPLPPCTCPHAFYSLNQYNYNTDRKPRQMLKTCSTYDLELIHIQNKPKHQHISLILDFFFLAPKMTPKLMLFISTLILHFLDFLYFFKFLALEMSKKPFPKLSYEKQPKTRGFRVFKACVSTNILAVSNVY